MLYNQPFKILHKTIFIRFKHCLGFENVEDVLVDIPETPFPGALFRAEFFLPQDKRDLIFNSDLIFMVKDVMHHFTPGVQHIIVVLEVIPRNPFSLMGIPTNLHG